MNNEAAFLLQSVIEIIKLLSFKDKVISTVFEENNRVGYALVWDCEDDVNLVRFDIY